MDELRTQLNTDGGVGPEQVKKLTTILRDYKSGKIHTERRVIDAEQWWKLRNNPEEGKERAIMAEPGSYKATSGWLHNVIVSKHADAMDAYPEPNILPREEGDKPEARILSAIIPVILEQNQFDQTYSDAQWQKLKTGTGIYKVTWDSGKLNGLGDISISRVSLLNIFWEPGVTDIQKSKYVFHTELVDKDLLQEQYPELEGKLRGNDFVESRFLYDDQVTNEDKATVIECYYHKRGRLHYVKYVGETVLYASENEPALAERGIYDHGLYPYVFDALFPVEGSPCGYGFVDLCRSPQTAIDLLNTSFIRNAMAGAIPRYFERVDGSVNEAEFLDLTKSIVHVNGNLGEDSLRQVNFNALPGVYVNVLEETINELRETSGNTQTAAGTANSGVTAASAIAALQEASGKGSRDSSLTSYRAYADIVNLCIELIRQFYDMPRQFRIVGNFGAEQFIQYSNEHLQPQHQGVDFGMDMGYRLPVFDIKVVPQKRSAYSKISQNELALQFYNLGFFNPQNSDQALATLGMMEFDDKDSVMNKIAQNGTMYQKLCQYMQLALQLAATAAPDMVPGLSQDIMQTMGTAPPQGSLPINLGDPQQESTRMVKARAQSQKSATPDAGSGAMG